MLSNTEYGISEILFRLHFRIPSWFIVQNVQRYLIFSAKNSMNFLNISLSEKRLISTNILILLLTCMYRYDMYSKLKRIQENQKIVTSGEHKCMYLNCFSSTEIIMSTECACSDIYFFYLDLYLIIQNNALSPTMCLNIKVIQCYLIFLTSFTEEIHIYLVLTFRIIC